jgi:hypothetical protein
LPAPIAPFDYFLYNHPEIYVLFGWPEAPSAGSFPYCLETMPTSHPIEPPALRAIKILSRSWRRIGLPLISLNEASLYRSAVRQTGMSDFGHDYFRQGLKRLLASAETDAGLHAVGRLAFRRWVIVHLANRLRLMEIRRRRPQLFSRPLKSPIIITGLPRSGTTLLHRLLAADPNHRGVPLWELIRPVPPAPGRPNRRRHIAKVEFFLRKQFSCAVDHKHFIRTHQPEECMWMLGLTFANMSFWMLAPVYGYLDWYRRQNFFEPKYREYRWLLQVLQAAAPTRRLILKAPEHMANIDVLLRTVPEALIIQTHRQAVDVVNSLNSLCASAHSSVAEHIDRHRMALANLELIAQAISDNRAARRKIPGRVYDIDYTDLTASPMDRIQMIYEHFALPWSARVAGCMARYLLQNPQNKFGRHCYRAEDYGLTDERIVGRLQGAGAKPPQR